MNVRDADGPIGISCRCEQVNVYRFSSQCATAKACSKYGSDILGDGAWNKGDVAVVHVWILSRHFCDIVYLLDEWTCEKDIEAVFSHFLEHDNRWFV